MVRVIFHGPDGEIIETNEPAGTTAMRAAVNADVPGIDADCGGACSCATCHVLVLGDWLSLTGPAEGTEYDMIGFDVDPEPNSRLSCQLELTPELDGLELQVVRSS